MGKKLKVIAKKDGFRRAGYAFSATKETVLDVDKLEKGQVEALKTETNLVVIEVDDADIKKAEAEKKKAEEEAKKEAEAAKRKAEEAAKKEAEANR